MEVVKTTVDAELSVDDVDAGMIVEEAVVETGSSIGAAFANKSVWAPSMKPYSAL